VFYAGDLTRPGCNAEFQAVDSRLVALKPKSWSFAEAAAIPLVTSPRGSCCSSAWAPIPAGANTGKSLLIINGAGGVGSALIPLARAVGSPSWPPPPGRKPATGASKLGAHHVINHRQPLRPQAEAIGIKQFPYIANLHNTEAYWDVTADFIAPFGALGLIVEPREKLHLGDPLKAKCVRIAWEFMAARAKFKPPTCSARAKSSRKSPAAATSAPSQNPHPRFRFPNR
jgi:NADPH:quinone reductase